MNIGTGAIRTLDELQPADLYPVGSWVPVAPEVAAAATGLDLEARVAELAAKAREEEGLS